MKSFIEPNCAYVHGRIFFEKVPPQLWSGSVFVYPQFYLDFVHVKCLHGIHNIRLDFPDELGSIALGMNPGKHAAHLIENYMYIGESANT